MEDNALSLVLRRGIQVRLADNVLPTSEIEINYYLTSPDPVLFVRFHSLVQASAGTFHIDLPSTESGLKGLSFPTVPAPVESPEIQEQVLRHVRLKLANPQDLKKIVKYVQACVCHPT